MMTLDKQNNLDYQTITYNNIILDNSNTPDNNTIPKTVTDNKKISDNKTKMSQFMKKSILASSREQERQRRRIAKYKETRRWVGGQLEGELVDKGRGKLSSQFKTRVT